MAHNILLPKLPAARDTPLKGISSRDLPALLRSDDPFLWETWHTMPAREEYHPGYCYLMRFGTGDRPLYKIGRSMNPVKRLESLERLMRKEGRLIHVIACRDMVEVEQDLHRAFEAKRCKMRRYQEFYWLDNLSLALICLLGPQ